MLIDCECYIYSWIQPVCTIYVLRLQKTVEVTAAGLPYSLLLTFPKALSTFVSSSSILSALQVRESLQEEFSMDFLSQSWKQFHTTAKDDPTGSRWGFELASACISFTLHEPPLFFLIRLFRQQLISALSFLMCHMMWSEFPVFPSHKGKPHFKKWRDVHCACLPPKELHIWSLHMLKGSRWTCDPFYAGLWARVTSVRPRGMSGGGHCETTQRKDG